VCGRFTLTTPGEELAELFGLDDTAELPPRYNIAPGTEVAAIGLDASRRRKTLRLLRWGLLPGWADDPRLGNRLLLARAESLAQRPAFADSYRRHRSAIPADGFFEWQRAAGSRRPWLVRRADRRPFAMAALYATWRRGDDRRTTCAIVTTPANDLVAPIHDRMPALLDPPSVDRWLRVEDPAELAALLRPAPAAGLVAFPVDPRVNRAEFDQPECVQPIA
jgi:putative SOS response-associated peptidase YedK